MALCGIELPCITKPVLVSRNGLDVEDEEPIEIDYDSAELPILYQAIEDKAFMAAIDFLESGKPEVYDEARTWVTRYEQDNRRRIRWSQLPLHAAIVFGGPPRLIELLVEIYPKAVRSNDDRLMLPIHLAFKKGSCDAILHCLLTKFPESINAKDARGRTPLQVQNSEKAVIIKMFEDNAKKQARKALTDEKISAVQQRFAAADQLNSNLQNKNEILDEENKALKERVGVLEQQIAKLNLELTTTKSSEQPVVAESTGMSKVRMSQRRQAAAGAAVDTVKEKDALATSSTKKASTMKTTKKKSYLNGLLGRSDNKTASPKTLEATTPAVVAVQEDVKEEKCIALEDATITPVEEGAKESSCDVTEEVVKEVDVDVVADLEPEKELVQEADTTKTIVSEEVANLEAEKEPVSEPVSEPVAETVVSEQAPVITKEVTPVPATTKRKGPKKSIFKILFGGRQRATKTPKTKVVKASAKKTVKEEDKEATINGSEDEQEKKTSAVDLEAIVVETVKDGSETSTTPVAEDEQSPHVVDPVAQ